MTAARMAGEALEGKREWQDAVRGRCRPRWRRRRSVGSWRWVWRWGEEGFKGRRRICVRRCCRACCRCCCRRRTVGGTRRVRGVRRGDAASFEASGRLADAVRAGDGGALALGVRGLLRAAVSAGRGTGRETAGGDRRRREVDLEHGGGSSCRDASRSSTCGMRRSTCGASARRSTGPVRNGAILVAGRLRGAGARAASPTCWRRCACARRPGSASNTSTQPAQDALSDVPRDGPVHRLRHCGEHVQGPGRRALQVPRHALGAWLALTPSSPCAWRSSTTPTTTSGSNAQRCLWPRERLVCHQMSHTCVSSACRQKTLLAWYAHAPHCLEIGWRPHGG